MKDRAHTAETADEDPFFVDYQLPRRRQPAVRSERSRRYVSPLLLRVLLPFVRYSASRNAYVLRGAGRRFGPVLRPRLADAEKRSKGPRARRR